MTGPFLVQPWGVTFARNSVRGSLAAHGEECILLKMWHPGDEDAPECRTCGGDDVYPSGGSLDIMGGVCPSCYGTSYDGGVRHAQRVWGMFSDHVASESYSKHGVWAGDAREIMMEPFPELKEHDYVVRVKRWSPDHKPIELGGYYGVEAVTRDSMRTGSRYGQAAWDVIGQKAQISRLQKNMPIYHYPIEGVAFPAWTPTTVTNTYQPVIVEPDTKVVYVPVTGNTDPTSPQDPGTQPGTDWEEVYTYVQDAPAATWTIRNPFSYNPTVTLIIGGEEADTDVLYPPDAPDGYVVLVFPTPQSGIAKLV